MKKWLRRIALAILALVFVAGAAGATYEFMGRRAARRAFPVQGELVDIGGRRLQVDCRGTGTPVVVLEAGLSTGGSQDWSAVHDSIAQTTRTCAYSRAGIMWSDAASEPLTARRVAEDLHAALGKAGEQPPYVLVGHSLGGPYIMTYTSHFGDEVAGLVMVDASHPDQLGRLKEVAPAAAEPNLTPMKVAQALSWAGVVRLAMSKAPPMPNQDPDVARSIAAYSSHSIDGAMQEMEALAATFDEAGKFRTLGDRPLVVLTAAKPMPDSIRAALKLTPEGAARMQAVWKAMQEEEASWSTRSRHVMVDDATHYIQFDRPDVVIEAVRSVVGIVRGTGATADSTAAATATATASR